MKIANAWLADKIGWIISLPPKNFTLSTMVASKRYLIEFVAITIAAGLAVRFLVVGLPTGLVLVAVVRSWLSGSSMLGVRSLALTIFTGACLLSLTFEVPQSWLFSPRVMQTGNSVSYFGPRLGSAAWGWVVFVAWALAAWRLQVEYRARVNAGGGAIEREVADKLSTEGALKGMEDGA